MCCTCEVCFLLIGSVVVVLWYHSCCFHLVFSITGFYSFFEETINIKRASLFSVAKSIYYTYCNSMGWTWDSILPSVTRSFDNSNLPLTRSNFYFLSIHFYIILPSITRTMFWTLKKSKKKLFMRIGFWSAVWNFPKIRKIIRVHSLKKKVSDGKTLWFPHRSIRELKRRRRRGLRKRHLKSEFAPLQTLPRLFQLV